MSINIGSKVQVWDEKRHFCLGWGKVVQIARNVHTDEMVPLIQLEGKSERKIWGDRCFWLEEKAAIEAEIRIFQDIKKGGEK